MRINQLTATLIFILFGMIANAQRPATKAETAEDARVLSILSKSMPHTVDGALEPAERSNGSSDISGTTGFDNNVNFATRDVFSHQYTISYQFTKAPEALKDKIEAAKARNDMEYIYGLSSVDVEVYINTEFPVPYYLHPMEKLNLPYCATAYRDAQATGGTLLFFGTGYSVSTSVFDGEDINNKPEKRYSLSVKHSPYQHGANIQSIAVLIKGYGDAADLIMKDINWGMIKGLLGTGNLQDDISTTTLKKYYSEKAVAPVEGPNTLSFTYTDATGIEKTFSIASTKHDRSNCAILRNHNENPQVLQESHLDIVLQDDKDQNILFTISIPIIRTKGKVSADFQSDYDYQVMWRGNPDQNHSFSPLAMDIYLTEWSPVGAFMEGTFSGTATLSDHNDLSTVKPVFTIKNGKFRVRRIADEMF
ncbi:MAG: hypothetical protein U0Y08_08605 [Bacteroidia bacterium]